MLAVIMAGGKGTRLVTLTKDEIPKPMAAICGKPLLWWQIESLKENGITDVVMIIGHLGCKIKEYFGDGSAFGVRIRYIEEKEPLGTAGALYYLCGQLDGEPFFLVFGDVLFDIDMKRMLDFHILKSSEVTLFAHPNAHPYDSDLIVTDTESKVIKFDSKNNDRSSYWYDNCVNAGLYVMQPAFCCRISILKKTDLEKELLSRMAERGERIFAYRSPEYVKDVGTIERIKKASKELETGYVTKRNLKYRQKAIFIDRDGTINKLNGLVWKEEQFELETFAVDAIRRINESGYLAIVITNQSVVARGLCEIEGVETIHQKMKSLLGREGVFLDDIKFCPHHPDKGYPEENPEYKIPCRCRKPDISMLMDCAKRYNIDLSQSWVIGDTTIDIRTGKNAGTKSALVLTGVAGKDCKYPDKPNLVCKDLLEAVVEITGG